MPCEDYPCCGHSEGECSGSGAGFYTADELRQLELDEAAQDAAERQEWERRQNVKLDETGYWCGNCDNFIATYEQGDLLPVVYLEPTGGYWGEYTELPPCQQCGCECIFPTDSL